MNSKEYSNFLAAAVLNHRRLTIATFVLALLTGAAITLMIPKKYESRMKILVKNERLGLVVSSDGTPSAAYKTDVSEAQINSEIELLTSNDLIEAVVRQCRLYEQDTW